MKPTQTSSQYDDRIDVSIETINMAIDTIRVTIKTIDAGCETISMNSTRSAMAHCGEACSGAMELSKWQLG